MTFSRPGRRTAALTAGLGLAAGSLLVAPVAPAAAAPQNDSAAAIAGGDWLVGQLDAGSVVYNDQFGFDDYASTVDFGLALDAFDGTRYDAALAELTGAVTTSAAVRGYTTTEEFDDPGSRYPGATGKLASFVQQRGGDATAVGGVDLVAELESLVADDAPIVGRVVDRTTFGDSANAIGQGFAARALTVAGSDQAEPVTDFFLQQQCDAGYFRTFLTPDKAATDQSCQGGVADDESAAAPDATAIAVINLLATQPATGSAAATAVDDAVQWLLDEQAADGSFTGGAGPTDTPNSNSTGVAGWALAEAGEDEAATRAAAFVAALQVSGCDTSDLSGQSGAVAYDDTAFERGADEGITVATRDQWRRASAQAVPALRSLEDVTLSPTGSARYVRAGSQVALTIDNLTAGREICVTGPRGTVAVTGPADTVRVPVPAGTATRTYRIEGESSTVSLQALAAKRLDVRRAKNVVARGATQTVTVRDLAPREKVTVRLRGKVVDTGVATQAGFFRGSFTVRGATGKAALKVTGQFPATRFGSNGFQVR